MLVHDLPVEFPHTGHELVVVGRHVRLDVELATPGWPTHGLDCHLFRQLPVEDLAVRAAEVTAQCTDGMPERFVLVERLKRVVVTHQCHELLKFTDFFALEPDLVESLVRILPKLILYIDISQCDEFVVADLRHRVRLRQSLCELLEVE